MVPLELAKLRALMERTSGSPDVQIGLIDGPVVTQHPDLVGEHIREIPGNNGATCAQANSAMRSGWRLRLVWACTPTRR